MAVDLIQFARTFSFALPKSMIAKGLPRVCPVDLEPVVRGACFRHGFENRQWLLDRIELHYSKIAIGPRLEQAPRKFV